MLTTNNQHTFCQRCISDTLDGLRQGLSHFAGPSRTAIIVRIKPEDPFYICDPENLLSGHEVRLHTVFSSLQNQKTDRNTMPENLHFGLLSTEPELYLSGVISYGCRSGPVNYQMWFTGHHPDICSTEPIKRWLEHAAWRFSHDMANGPVLYTGISGTFLKEYATQAVQDFLLDQLNIAFGLDNRIILDLLLNTVLELSSTREEGSLPHGRLSFIEPRFIGDISFLARLRRDERPQLENVKHVRKLLQTVEDSDNHLVSDGLSIVGIAGPEALPFAITADFQGQHGFLKLGQDPVCSFSRGRFQASTMQAKLVEVEEALLESKLDFTQRNTLFTSIAELVHRAQQIRFGCTLIIDLNEKPLDLHGQVLEQPLDLSNTHLRELASSLSRVDGTLHIDRLCRLLAFGCILDGAAISSENLGRGARYNSALRFSTMHDKVIIVVVSSDRPVSVIRHGIEISSRCLWQPQTSSVFPIMPLEKWLG